MWLVVCQIVGPNGTGKSSVVSAVCVVLGGKLQLLGKSQDLGSYVRHGAEEAMVEAWLYDPESSAGVARISRRFRKDGGTSTYSINGKKATIAEVDKLKRRFDIQLDNLSQFMPQEKIAEFVQMDPKSLLACTVRALGGTAKLELYEKLLQTDSSFVSDDDSLGRKEKTLADFMAKSKALETEVEAFHAHKKLKDEVKKLKNFIPWLEHEDVQMEFNDLKNDVKMCKEKVEEKKTAAEALRGPLVHIQRRHEAAWKAFDKEEKRKSRDKDDKALKLVNDVDELIGQIEDLKAKLESNDKHVAKHRDRINDVERALEADKGRLEEANRRGNDAEDNAVIAATQAKRRALRAESNDTRMRLQQAKNDRGDVERRIHTLNVQLSRLADARTHRMQELERSNRRVQGIGKVADWILDNPQLFKRKVHGPVAVEVDAENELSARVLNSSLGAFTLGCFVLECHDDVDTLKREAQAKFGFRVSTMTAPCSNGQWDPNDIMLPGRPVDQQLHSLGIDAVVSDLFKAPDAVKEALKAQHGLNNMFVGNQNADRNMDELVNAGLHRWYTPTGQYNCVTSRYNRSARSTSVGSLQPPGIFAGRIDQVERERAQLMQSIKAEEANLTAASEQLSLLEAEMRGYIEQDKELGEEIAKANGYITARARLAQKVRTAESRIATLRSGNAIKDATAKRNRILENLAVNERKIVSTSEELVAALSASVRALGKMDEAMNIFSAVVRELREEEAKHSETSNELQEMQTLYGSMKERLSRTRQKVRDARAKAEKSVSSAEVSDDPFYEELGMDLQKVNGLILEKTEAASRMTTGGGQVVEEHAKYVQKAEALQAELTRTRESQANERREFEESKVVFMNWLDERIERMAVRFSNLYKGFGCRGDIVLINKDDERMSALAINILVSYRDGVDLMPISGQGNSGGEKMACTMLYCFSLQEQEKSPPFVVSTTYTKLCRGNYVLGDISHSLTWY